MKGAGFTEFMHGRTTIAGLRLAFGASSAPASRRERRRKRSGMRELWQLRSEAHDRHRPATRVSAAPRIGALAGWTGRGFDHRAECSRAGRRRVEIRPAAVQQQELVDAQQTVMAATVVHAEARSALAAHAAARHRCPCLRCPCARHLRDGHAIDAMLARALAGQSGTASAQRRRAAVRAWKPRSRGSAAGFVPALSGGMKRAGEDVGHRGLVRCSASVVSVPLFNRGTQRSGALDRGADARANLKRAAMARRHSRANHAGI